MNACLPLLHGVPFYMKQPPTTVNAFHWRAAQEPCKVVCQSAPREKRSNGRAKDVDLSAAIRDILGGMSIREVAPRYGVSHVTLGRKLKATNRGSYAVEVATNRAIDANVQAMNEAKQRRAA